jgi:hypothetical protein
MMLLSAQLFAAQGRSTPSMLDNKHLKDGYGIWSLDCFKREGLLIVPLRNRPKTNRCYELSGMIGDNFRTAQISSKALIRYLF